jgi:hypothetical protein
MIREKDYLSWSQFSLWQSSKREYWKRYGLGVDRSANKYFEKGRELASALEHDDDGSWSQDELLSVVLAEIPKLDLMEYKVEIELSNGERTLSYLDSCAIDDSEFYEYKTGKKPWTQEMVEAHDQLLFYATALYIKSGRVSVPTCKLIWIETEQTEEGLKYTGLVQEFPREFTEVEIIAFEEKLIGTIHEIELFEYKELEIDDEVMDRYIFLCEEIKKMVEEAELIKLGIQVEMETDGLKYANATNGKFTMAETKSWTYSEELKDIQAKFSKQVKIAQTQEQKEGVAKCGIKTSIKFSLNKV